MSGTGTQVHDFNGGINPLFWTVRIPDNALSMGGDGKVRLRAVDVPVVDDLVFTLPAGAEHPSRVSFDVTYTPVGKVRHLRPGSSDPMDPKNFAGELRYATSMGSFSGTNLTTGFSFTATGTTAGGGFSEMGTERNGFFLH